MKVAFGFLQKYASNIYLICREKICMLFYYPLFMHSINKGIKTSASFFHYMPVAKLQY